MLISQTEIYKFSIPMHPFTIATGTMEYAQNIFIRIRTDDGITGVGECSAFPMITGETQNTCFEVGKDFASLWKKKNPLDIRERVNELHAYVANNHTIKSAFDMALFDIAAKVAGLPLYQFLGAKTKRILETDITVGMGDPQEMASRAATYVAGGFNIIKIKLGGEPGLDVERVSQIRQAVGPEIILRIDANQGWDFESARKVLSQIGELNIQFCEQPMRSWDDHQLPELRKRSSIPLMADESVYDHHDAERLINAEACDYINIKFAKTGGILEALLLNKTAEQHKIPCMMGGMLESRVALTAFAHFATAAENIIFYDMDTCLLGHKQDPVSGGVAFRGRFLELPDQTGIGANVNEDFLRALENAVI